MTPGLPYPNPLLQQYLALQQAIAGGVVEVRFQDRTVRYASMAELIVASNRLYQQLAATGALGGGGMNRTIRCYTTKGL